MACHRKQRESCSIQIKMVCIMKDVIAMAAHVLSEYDDLFADIFMMRDEMSKIISEKNNLKYNTASYSHSYIASYSKEPMIHLMGDYHKSRYMEERVYTLRLPHYDNIEEYHTKLRKNTLS